MPRKVSREELYHQLREAERVVNRLTRKLFVLEKRRLEDEKRRIAQGLVLKGLEDTFATRAVDLWIDVKARYAIGRYGK